MKLKVCGVQSHEELQMLDECGVDLAGVWWNLAQGRRNLSGPQLAALAAVPLQAARLVLVTIGRSADALVEVLSSCGIGAVQLSGFELPGLVSQLRSALPRLRIYKTLHVQDEVCLQERYLAAYQAAGVDAFIADSFVSRQAPGSTGVRLAPSVVAALVQRVAPLPVLLAGGVDAALLAGPLDARLHGIDVDTAARGGDGGIARERVLGLVAAVRSLQREPAEVLEEALA